MNLQQLLAQSKENTDLLTIEATVITGFEFIALDECREKCKPLSITKAKGRIFFNVHSRDFNKVLSLRAVDNVLLVVETIKDIPFEGKKDKDLEIVKSFVDTVEWDHSLKKWAEITEFKGILYPNKITTKSITVGLAENDLLNHPHEMDSSNLKNVTCDKGCKEVSHDENTLSVPLNITSQNVDEKISDSSPVLCIQKDNSSKYYDEKMSESDKLEEHTIDVIDEEVNYFNKELVSAPKESETTHLVHEQGVHNTSGQKYPREINVDEHASQVKSETNSNDHKLDDLKGIESIESNSITLEKDNCENDSVNQVKSHENVCDNKAFVNQGYANDGDKVKEKTDARPEESKILLAEKRPSRKQQFRGKNRHYDQKKSSGRRGQRVNSKSDQDKSDENEDVLKFRATCYRIGEKHSFSSMEAAWEFGGTLQDKFGWTVDLTRFNLNVVLNIEYKQGYICVAITKESLHRRNISHFSNTTLRATMCYNLFRLAEPMTGEIVIDPLCGGGSISIEGTLSFPNTFHICGDYNRKAVERTRANIDYMNKTKAQCKIGAVLWDVKHLPLRTQSVDVLVTDLPFGKRSGAKRDNLRLYSKVLFELAKFVKTGTGRASLLTYDKTSFIRALRTQSTYWREIRQFGVNQGGLFSSVFLLLRKANAVPETTSEESFETIVQTDPASSIQDDEMRRLDNTDSAEKKSNNHNCLPDGKEVSDETLTEQNIESEATHDTKLQSNTVSVKEEKQSAMFASNIENIAGDKLEIIAQSFQDSPDDTN